MLTDLGKRTSDIGIPLVYLNHLNSVSERPEGLVRPKRLEDFAELGRGDVNIPGVFVALRQIKILGWAIVELDGENDKSRTPKESAEISKGILRRN